MENIEQSQEPERLIDEEKIIKIFEAVKRKIPQEYEMFEFNDTYYQIIYINRKEITDNVDAFYSASTQIPGFDIYLYKQLSRSEKERRLFHEIIEIEVGKKIATSDAHKFALEKEEELFGRRS
jgi:hypothetical protein